jgi:arylsulfatase A-like enzyme
MIKIIAKIGNCDQTNAILLVLAASIGVVLPIDFLLAVDGYLVFLRPWELIPVWGWAWVYYAVFGLAIGGLTAGLATLAALVLRKNQSSIVLVVGRWASMSLITVALVRALKLWIGLHFVGLDGWLGQNQRWVAAVVLISCAIAARRKSAERPAHNRLLVFMAACGLALTLAAPIVTSLNEFKPATGRQITDGHSSVRDHPDIILLTADAFAANHASFMGYRRETTPALAELAKESDVFVRYYANSNFTTASVNSFINGVRPWTHRANQFLARVSDKISGNGLVQRLSCAGYETAAVWTNSLAAPFLNSTDRWFDSTEFATTNYSGPLISSVMCTKFSHFTPVTELGAFITTTKIIDRIAIMMGFWSMTDQNALEPAFVQAREAINHRDSSRPLFLWIHVMRPHSPYAAPPPFLGQFAPGAHFRTRYDSSPTNEFFVSKADDERQETFSARYDESLAYLDFTIGDFLSWLKGKGIYDKTLLIVSSDHGESFSHRYGTHAGPMLFDDLIHVPLLIKEPSQKVGKTIESIAEQIDLMPTILDLATVPAGGAMEGISLKPAIHGTVLRRPVFSMNFEQNSRFASLDKGSIAMIDGHWKYVRFYGHLQGPSIPRLNDTLFDLELDPGESTDLIKVQRVIADRMRAEIDKQLREHDKPVD